MDPERELSLLALLEWEERIERWLRVSAPDREVFVEELARLMVQQEIRRGRTDERVISDYEPPS